MYRGSTRAAFRARRRRLVLATLVAFTAAGGVAGLVLFLEPGDPVPTQLTIKGEDLQSPWCNDEGTVCVTSESLAQGFAIYTVEPHSYFRQRGCRAAWRPDFELSQVGGVGFGAFRSPCSGATFDRAGHRLFGPSDRDLDRYLAEGEPGRFRVFLSQLQPGPAQ